MVATAVFPSFAKLRTTGFGEKPQSAVRRTQMEDGFTKQSRRYTRQMVVRPVEYWLETKQVLADFKAWYINNINRGASWFLWDDPVDGITKEARIKEGNIEYVPLENTLQYDWLAKFELEVWE